MDAPGIRGVLKIQRKAPLPRAPLRPPGFCPTSWCLPQSRGEGRRGEAGAPSPFWFPLSLQQLLPNEPRHGDVQPTSHPQLHTSRTENWEGGRRAGRGSRSWVGGSGTRTHLQTSSPSRLWTSGSRRRYPSEFALALNTSPLNQSLEKKQPLFPLHPTPLARFQLS